MKKNPAEHERKVQSLESKAKFSRNEYLLELAAANVHYEKFRDEQCPEVLDVRAGRAHFCFLRVTFSRLSCNSRVFCPILIPARRCLPQTISSSTSKWLQMMLTNVCRAFARPTSRAMRTYDTLAHCAKMLSAEYERKVFIEDQASDVFPGRSARCGMRLCVLLLPRHVATSNVKRGRRLIPPLPPTPPCRASVFAATSPL